jgi:Zn-dependent peptidase ImmA (M78 family)/transcriptional regulator with XRE-family HTH domain
MPDNNTGERLLRLRLSAGIGQIELAERANIAAGTISMVERGHAVLDLRAMIAVAEVLDVSPEYLSRSRPEFAATTPQLRAYADASQKVVDRFRADSVTAVEAIRDAGLRLVPDVLPVFDGDVNDAAQIEAIAMDARTLAGLGDSDPVGNSIRAAERLGCVVLPMESELGRHLGLSLRVDDVPVIRVARTSLDSEDAVPGDRQRFTVAHELGHLVLHAGLGAPLSADEGSRREREAHRFASGFLTPGDAVLQDLGELGGRVTLTNLSRLKDKWGLSIKAFVVRFRQLGVIDDEQARSLYKQISARKWNKSEPVIVGNESAVWLSKAVESSSEAIAGSGLGGAYFHRWLDWSARGHSAVDAVVTPMRASQGRRQRTGREGTAPVTRLPVSRQR